MPRINCIFLLQDAHIISSECILSAPVGALMCDFLFGNYDRPTIRPTNHPHGHVASYGGYTSNNDSDVEINCLKRREISFRMGR